MTPRMPAAIELETRSAAEVIDITDRVEAPRRREIEVRLLAEA
jgi:hypothetical protein